MKKEDFSGGFFNVLDSFDNPFIFELLKHLPVRVFWKDRKGKYLGCNDLFARDFGLASAEAVIGKTDYDLPVRKENNDAYRQDDKKVMDSRIPMLNIEEERIFLDGRKGYLLTSKVPVCDKKNEVVGVLGIYNDISELKETQTALQVALHNTQSTSKELHSYLETIVNTVPNTIFWKDRHSIFLGCNELFAKLAGLKSPKDIVGKSDYDLPWSKEQSDHYRAIDKEVMLSGQPKLNVEEFQTLENGIDTVLLTSKVPLRDAYGNITGVLGVYTDITERKQVEEALKLAKEKAEVANLAKTEFLENMRHDIRTPLSGIVGCAQLIQMQANNPKKVAAYAEDLVQSSDALLDFLNKILESIKVASGEIPLLKQKFDLHQILEQAVHLNKPQADIKHLNLHLKYDKTIPAYLLGDPIRIQRIILELLTNALKFTDKGEINLAARLMRNKTRTGQMVIELSVSDTGMGIPREKQNEIYTRFTRLTPSYQGIYSGTGLGLSVVKQFIDDLGGEIQLDSQPNQGSTFRCFIPLYESLSTNDEGEAEEVRSFVRGSHRAVKETVQELEPQETPVATGSYVLVVEDNIIATKVARGVLEELNCQIDIAPDGKTALTLIEKNHYDLIFMDIGLPDGDGCDVTRRIRLKQWQRNPSVPIIGLTAHIDDEKKRHCLANGMNAIYTKPLTLEKGSSILNAFLSHSQQPILKESLDKSTNDLQSLPLLDNDRALKLLGNKETLHELLALLESGLTKEIADLKQYHQNKDWSQIRALAHKWKGGSSYCGASRLEKVCQAMEAALQAELLEKAEAVYQQLLQIAEATKEAAKQTISYK